MAALVPFWGKSYIGSICGKQLANCFGELCGVSVKLFWPVRKDCAVNTVSRRWVNKVPEGLEIGQSDMAASHLDGNTLEKNVLDCYEL